MENINIIDKGELRHRVNSKNEFFLIVCLEPELYRKFGEYVNQYKMKRDKLGYKYDDLGFSFEQFLEGLGIMVKEKKH